MFKKNKCKYCKSKKFLTKDHKVPLSQGGKDIPSNWQCLCERCNGIKSSLSDKQVRRLFRWFLEIQKSRIEYNNKPYKL